MKSLREVVADYQRSIIDTEKLLGFPYEWQRPAATELAAYDAVRGLDVKGWQYIAFPWATLIDGLRGDAASVRELLDALVQMGLSAKGKRRRFTVAQHIHAYQFHSIFSALGIEAVFWSHAVKDGTRMLGVKILPFSLFPAQTADVRVASVDSQGKKYLANFIGAYNKNVYLTNVRQVIFDDEGKYDDLLIIRREAWHFDRVVYDEQIGGRAADKAKLDLEEARAKEYLDAIRDSWFTLCPSGSGPNSIRIFECLCLGSIPVILTDDLQLPFGAGEWSKVAIIEEDSEEGYRRAVERCRAIPDEERLSMLEAGQKFALKVLPEGYSRYIGDMLTTLK